MPAGWEIGSSSSTSPRWNLSKHSWISTGSPFSPKYPSNRPPLTNYSLSIHRPTLKAYTQMTLPVYSHHPTWSFIVVFTAIKMICFEALPAAEHQSMHRWAPKAAVINQKSGNMISRAFLMSTRHEHYLFNIEAYSMDSGKWMAFSCTHERASEASLSESDTSKIKIVKKIKIATWCHLCLEDVVFMAEISGVFQCEQ